MRERIIGWLLNLLEDSIVKIFNREIREWDDMQRGIAARIQNENQRIEMGVYEYHAQVNGITPEKAKELIDAGLINTETI